MQPPDNVKRSRRMRATRLPFSGSPPLGSRAVFRLRRYESIRLRGDRVGNSQPAGGNSSRFERADFSTAQGDRLTWAGLRSAVADIPANRHVGVGLGWHCVCVTIPPKEGCLGSPSRVTGDALSNRMGRPTWRPRRNHACRRITRGGGIHQSWFRSGARGVCRELRATR